MKRTLPILLFAVVALVPPAGAGQFNKVLNIGDKAPVWSDLVGVDDEQHSFDDLADNKVIVVAFICNSCIYATDAEDRVIALQKKYADQGVAIVAINANKIEEDRLPAMKERAKEKGFSFPYLFDEAQQTAKDYGAMYTPEFFVLDPKRHVVYMGSLDDSPDGAAVSKRYVEAAVDAVLAGEQPAVAETVPIGCRIRMERRRRSRRSAKQ